MTILVILLLFLWGIFEIINCYKEGLVSNDPIILYYHIIQDLSLYYLQILMPLFIVIPAIWIFHKELHSGYIKYCLTRENYRTYLKKNYIKALLNAFILPFIVVVLVLLCCMITKGFAFGSGKELYGWIASPDVQYLSNLPLFMVTYILVMFLHGIFYVNLGLMCCKKNSNILVTIILSYLLFLIIDIILEVFVGNLLLARILGIHNIASSLSLVNIWTYEGVVSLSFIIIYSLALVIISTLVLYFIYKNKEDVLYASEK